MTDKYDEDISLRLVELGDIDDEYCDWYKNSDGHLDFFSGSGKKFTKKVIIEDFKTGMITETWFYYIILSSTGVRIGNIKIGPIDHTNKTSDLVCLIGNRNFLGKGLASRAIKLGNQIAFNDYGIRRLHGGMHAQNVASIKAYTNAGWIIEAELKGYFMVNEVAQNRICVACFNPRYF